MTYFLSDRLLRVGELVELAGEEAHHAAVARRLRPGDTFALQGPDGARFRVVVEGGGARAFRVRVLEPVQPPPPPALRVTLLQAAVKAKAAEWIVRKSTELGVARLAFYPSAHSAVAPRELERERARGRWERIAWEACKQCDRSFPPELHVATGLEDAMRWAGAADLSWLFHPSEGRPAPALLAERPLRAGAPETARLLIGPEGGFTPDELRAAWEQGFEAVALGEYVLRAETAAVAACALALFGT
jgi:16S rRNA (uracil1498-N3)-methyltransferase